MLNVAVITNIPAPHQVALFDRISQDGRIGLNVVYQYSSLPDRQWDFPAIAHRHTILENGGHRRAEAIVGEADLVVFGGYRDRFIRKLLRERAKSGQAFAFWGERPGFSGHDFAGRLFRRVMLRHLHDVNAPIWGFGRWAVSGYRAEFGADRKYLNVPYFSDLGDYLKIDRQSPAAGPPVFLYSGQFIDRKGVDLLAAAFSNLRRAGYSAKLYLVGSGPLEAKLRDMLAPFGDDVKFLPFRQPADLPAVYAQGDVLCAPSRHDGWGLIVQEALAAAMPVISTDRTGAALDLLSPEAGWVIPAGSLEAVRGAMADAIRRGVAGLRQMGEAARRIAPTLDVGEGSRVFAEAARESFDEFK